MESHVCQILQNIHSAVNFAVFTAGFAILAMLVNRLNQPRCTLLLESHVINPKCFLGTLAKADDPVSEFLRSQFPKQTERWLAMLDLSRDVPRSVLRNVISELNAILEADKLWQAAESGRVPLDTSRTAAMGVFQRNRSLLQAAYPQEVEFSNDVRKPIKILNLDILPEYFSLIYGILYGLLVLFLTSQILLLDAAIHKFPPTPEVVEKIVSYPWIASPFHYSVWPLVLFFGILAVGLVELGFVTDGHLREHPPENRFLTSSVFKFIGKVDLAIFCGSVIILRAYMVPTVLCLRTTLLNW